jgi:hypothetical protein
VPVPSDATALLARGETGWKSSFWGATAFSFQLQGAKFLTERQFRLCRYPLDLAVSCASRALRRWIREVALARTEPQGSGPKPKHSAANSPVSLVDGVAFVDGPV